MAVARLRRIDAVFAAHSYRYTASTGPLDDDGPLVEFLWSPVDICRAQSRIGIGCSCVVGTCARKLASLEFPGA